MPDDIGMERVGFTQFTATNGGVSGGAEEISSVENCEEAVFELLRRINTRPGDDEEVQIQIVVRHRPERGFREAISRRIDR